MNELFTSTDDEGSGTVFRDVILLALAGFVMLVLMLLPHVNPPNAGEAQVKSPGNLIVEIRWPDDLDADVDLWVEAPSDQPVGYSNESGSVFNLLRDDLGYIGDLTELNYEVAYSRGTPAGPYTINLHMYRNRVGRFPVPVTVAISVKRDGAGESESLLAEQFDLGHDGEELTAFRFELTDQGRLVPGSVHRLPRPLRDRGDR